MLYNKNEFKSLKAVYKALDNCMETILVSNKKKEITMSWRLVDV